jgi:hypothetical protein
MNYIIILIYYEINGSLVVKELTQTANRTDDVMIGRDLANNDDKIRARFIWGLSICCCINL